MTVTNTDIATPGAGDSGMPPTADDLHPLRGDDTDQCLGGI